MGIDYIIPKASIEQIFAAVRERKFLLIVPAAHFFFFFVSLSSWLNTTFMEDRKILNTSDLDGFDKVRHCY